VCHSFDDAMEDAQGMTFGQSGPDPHVEKFECRSIRVCRDSRAVKTLRGKGA
jgi:hypothetical protein